MWRRRVIVGTLLWSSLCAQVPQPIERNVSQPAQEQSGRQQSVEDAAVSDSLRRLAQAVEAQQKDPKAKEDRERAEQDLKAQKEMATYTWLMAIVSVGALLLSTLGVYLIFVTFKQTRRGALYAGVGARQSRRALAHMQGVSQAELRPYLFIDKVNLIERDELHYKVEICYKNFGRTPARNIRAFTECYKAHSPSDLRQIDMSDPVAAGVAAPDHSRRTFDYFDYSELEWQGAYPAVVVLRVYYTYTGDGDSEFSEAGDYFLELRNLKEGDRTFYLLTADIQERFRLFRAEPRGVVELDTPADQAARRKPAGKRRSKRRTRPKDPESKPE